MSDTRPALESTDVISLGDETRATPRGAPDMDTVGERSRCFVRRLLSPSGVCCHRPRSLTALGVAADRV